MIEAKEEKKKIFQALLTETEIIWRWGNSKEHHEILLILFKEQ